MATKPLTCPRCALTHSLEERFCRDCGMPLVYAGLRDEQPITEQQERARKIKPQYAQGELVRVGGGRNQADAEMIQGLLLEEGIPSILRRTAGFDVPDFLAAGPRDVMVPAAGSEVARRMLIEAGLVDPGPAAGAGPQSAVKLLAWILVAVAVGAGLVFAISQAAS